jgi:hypothetical protein
MESLVRPLPQVSQPRFTGLKSKLRGSNIEGA